MLVLYRELRSFDHLESYIEQNDLSVIYSNVAISWAIHDQKLDESIDISNKTTTNIRAEDFCRTVDLGGFFADNGLTFHQQAAIASMKEHFPSYRQVYELWQDSLSQKRYFAFLMFCLCPYIAGFFRGLIGGESIPGNFLQNKIQEIVSNQLEIGEKKPTLTLSMAYDLVHFKDLPLLLQEINPLQDFALDVYRKQDKLQMILTATPRLLQEKAPATVVAESSTPEPGNLTMADQKEIQQVCMAEELEEVAECLKSQWEEEKQQDSAEIVQACENKTVSVPVENDSQRMGQLGEKFDEIEAELEDFKWELDDQLEEDEEAEEVLESAEEAEEEQESVEEAEEELESVEEAEEELESAEETEKELESVEEAEEELESAEEAEEEQESVEEAEDELESVEEAEEEQESVEETEEELESVEEAEEEPESAEETEEELESAEETEEELESAEEAEDELESAEETEEELESAEETEEELESAEEAEEELESAEETEEELESAEEELESVEEAEEELESVEEAEEEPESVEETEEELESAEEAEEELESVEEAEEELESVAEAEDELESVEEELESVEEAEEELESAEEELESAEEELESAEEAEEEQESVEETEEELESVEEAEEELESVEEAEEELESAEETEEELESVEETEEEQESVEETEEELESVEETEEELEMLEETVVEEVELGLPREPESDVSEEEAIEKLLEDIHLPETVKAEPVAPVKRSEAEIAALMERMKPVLPVVETITMPRDTLDKSLDLLTTMEELVSFVRQQYPLEDTLYQDLLASMATGLESLQQILTPNEE